MLLFRSVVFDIRSVECFIQSVVHVTFSIRVVFDIRSVACFIQSVVCDFFDQLCLIFDQLCVLFNQLYM